MFGLGIGEILILAFVVLILFGVKRIPELGHALGKGIKNFKKGISERQTDSIEK